MSTTKWCVNFNFKNLNCYKKLYLGNFYVSKLLLYKFIENHIFNYHVFWPNKYNLIKIYRIKAKKQKISDVYK